MTDEFVGVGRKRSGDRPVDRQFSQCARDQKDHNPADGIIQKQAWPGFVNSFAGPEEQPRTDGPADCDELDVEDIPRPELLFEIAELLLDGTVR